MFLADVKGDLAGIAMPGSPTFKHADKLEARAAELGMADYAYADNPAVFWDLYGEQGHPIRTTVSEMGPLLLGPAARAQRDAGRRAQHRLPLRRRPGPAAARPRGPAGDAGPHRRARERADHEVRQRLARPPSARSSASCSSLDSQGGALFFGEPALEIADFIRTDEQGRGIINVLAADRLMRSPKLYATFLLWLLAELFEVLPEVGDPEKPKLVFFFDEAHLLFDDAPDALLDKIEQVVRLIRSKGVGVYLRHPEPDRHSREGRRPARQPRAARAARLHPARPEGDQGGGRDLPHQSRARRRDRDHRAQGRRGAGLDADGGRRALGGPAHADQAAAHRGSARSTRKERAIVQSVSPFAGKYDTRVDRESAEEVLAQKAADAAATAAGSRGEGRARKSAGASGSSPSIWSKAAKRAGGAATGSARDDRRGGGHRAQVALEPDAQTAATSAAGSIATDLAGPFVGRFVRNLIGGLMR